MAGDVEGPRILVGLHTDEGDEPEIAVAFEPAEQPGNVDAGVRFIDRHDVDGDTWSEHLTFGAIGGDAVDGGQRI